VIHEVWGNKTKQNRFERALAKTVSLSISHISLEQEVENKGDFSYD